MVTGASISTGDSVTNGAWVGNKAISEGVASGSYGGNVDIEVYGVNAEDGGFVGKAS